MRAHSSWRSVFGVGGVLITAMLTAACAAPSPEIVKVGLAAPFEGRYREIGYQVIPAVRTAIQEWAAAAPADTPIAIELVAYDDMGDPALAVEQAHKLAADPTVAVVIGHWRAGTTEAAAPIYAEAGLPFIAFGPGQTALPEDSLNLSASRELLLAEAESWASTRLRGCRVSFQPELLEADFRLRYQETIDCRIDGPETGLGQYYAASEGGLAGVYFVHSAEPMPPGAESFTGGFSEASLGAPPGLLSWTAYRAAWLAIDRIGAQYSVDAPIPAALEPLAPDMPQPVYLYQWQDGQINMVEQLNAR